MFLDERKEIQAFDLSSESHGKLFKGSSGVVAVSVRTVNLSSLASYKDDLTQM